MPEIRVLLQEDLLALRVVRRAAQGSRADFGLRIAKFCGSPSAPVTQTGAVSLDAISCTGVPNRCELELNARILILATALGKNTERCLLA